MLKGTSVTQNRQNSKSEKSEKRKNKTQINKILFSLATKVKAMFLII